jgi:hypothetical protein
MVNKTAAELNALVTAYQAATAPKNNKTKSDYRKLITEGWIEKITNLNDSLVKAATLGRKFVTINSPVIINDGPATDDISANKAKDLYREKDFRAYLKTIQDPALLLKDLVGADVKIEDISEPFIIPGNPRPTTPRNVVFRYRFSW